MLAGQYDPAVDGDQDHSHLVVCGLAAAIKLWGLFFVLAIAGYLLAGLLRKKLTPGKMILAGALFILTMFQLTYSVIL